VLDEGQNEVFRGNLVPFADFGWCKGREKEDPHKSAVFSLLLSLRKQRK
jgi:hypothetical protein